MKYRKKPVVVDAWQFTDQFKDRVYHTVSEFNYGVTPSRDASGAPCLLIPTLEGEMTASLNDWIIRGVKGELYPCKPDVFEATYEAVELVGETTDQQVGTPSSENALTVKSPMDMELFKSSVAAFLMALTFVAVWVVTP